jgi:hypothetical protein
MDKNVVVKIRAEASGDGFRQTEEGAHKAARGAKALSEEMNRLRAPARSTQQVLSNVFLDMGKQSAEATKKVDQLAQSFRRLGISVGDAHAMTKQLSKELGLTARQIEQAMAKGIGGGRPGFFGAMGALGGQLLGPGGLTGLGVYGLARAGESLGETDDAITSLRALRMRPTAPTLEQEEAIMRRIPVVGRGVQATMGTARLIYGIRERMGLEESDRAKESERERRQRVPAQRRLELEELAERRISVREPFFAERRALEQEIAGMRGAVGARLHAIEMGQQMRGTQGAFGAELAGIQLRGAPTIFQGPGGIQARAQLQQMQEQMAFGGIAAGERLGGIQGAITTERRQQTLRQFDLAAATTELQKQLQLQREGKTIHGELNAARQRGADILRAISDGQLRINDLTMREAEVRKDITRMNREQANAAFESVRQQRAAAQEQSKDQMTQLAFGDPMAINRALQIGRMLKSGNLGEGRAPFMRMGRGGRFELVPGQQTALRPEDLGMASSLFPDMLRKAAEQRIKSHPELQDLREMLTSTRRAKELAGVEKELGVVRDKLEIKMVMDEKAAAEQWAKLLPKFIESQNKFMKMMQDMMEQKLHQQEVLRSWQHLAAGLGLGTAGS